MFVPHCVPKSIVPDYLPKKGKPVTFAECFVTCRSCLTLPLYSLAMVQLEQGWKLDQLRDHVMAAEGPEEKVEGECKTMS